MKKLKVAKIKNVYKIYFIIIKKQKNTLKDKLYII